jgi:ferritin
MTHDHDHSHDSKHTHAHSHSHADEMSLEEKLEKLVAHWIDHNDSHKETFLTWAQRAQEHGLDGVAQKINQAGTLSEQVTLLLKQTLSELEK